MKKLNINYLYLEVTRRCNLECAHCLGGERQNVDMSEEILDNILKDVTHIHVLDLGGGEPLLVPQVIESIIDKINIYGIKVDKIHFTTNGTILTSRVVDIIRRLQNIASLEVRLSHDKFHLLELYLKGLVKKVVENSAMFTEILGYNPKDKDFVMDSGAIARIGKAKTLTQEDLDAINKWIIPTYYHLSFERSNALNIVEMYDWEKDVVHVCGTVTISATGYLTQADKEYEEEDKGPIFGINVKDKSLLDALIQYEENYKHSLGEEKYQDYRDKIDSRYRK